MQEKLIGVDTAVLDTGAVTMNLYCVAVESATEGQVSNPAATKADKIFGILQKKTHVAGENAPYCFLGKSYVTIASAVNPKDQLVIADTQGRVRAKTTSAGDAELPVLGTAESAGTLANSQVVCAIQINNSCHS